MEEFTGTLVHSILLQETPMMLSLGILSDGKNSVECLIKDRYLANYIFRLPSKKYQLKVVGKRNRRNQLVVKTMEILNVDEYIKIIGTPE